MLAYLKYLVQPIQVDHGVSGALPWNYKRRLTAGQPALALETGE